MCGINGILRLSDAAPAIDDAKLLACRDAMAARGPDGAGAWRSGDGRVALGHRRLSVLDLSPAGAQPMTSACGRFTIVINGEIYNFRALRAELAAAGQTFRSESDTEVVLALYARHGVAMLERLHGMFALALWDGPRETLLLARDPLGIKPLYYSVSGGELRFASQVKALEAVGWAREVDPAGLAGFLLWGSVPEPRTFRRGVWALPAGHYALARGGRLEEPRAYYRFVVEEPLTPTLSPPAGRGGRNEIEDLSSALEGSVAAHLVSDVAVAVFLSAGLDSSLIAALAARRSSTPLSTFTLSFDTQAGTALDEAPLAAETARRLGARHRERRVGRADFAGLWEAALAAMDQPSIDGFNTYLVTRLAHEEGMKVVLSGLGGDELFGSYPSFTHVPRAAGFARRARRLPGLRALWPALARRGSPGRPKLAGLLAHGGSLEGAYFLRRGLFLPEELPGLLGEEAAREGLAAYDPVADGRRHLAELAGRADPWLAVHALETALYMRNQLLRDSDWAAMAHSVELRVPLVDAPLRKSLAARGFAVARRLGKAGVVAAVAPELPREIFRRPKSGFYAPVTEWRSEGGAAPPASRGLGSRGLALAVLASFGVELDA